MFDSSGNVVGLVSIGFVSAHGCETRHDWSRANGLWAGPMPTACQVEGRQQGTVNTHRPKYASCDTIGSSEVVTLVSLTLVSHSLVKMHNPLPSVCCASTTFLPEESPFLGEG